MNFGNRIVELRNEKKLTQEELARKLEITRASLSHYENNRREPDHETTQKLANFFNVSVDYLLSRTKDPKASVYLETSAFTDSLELSDQEILKRFNLTIDGKALTIEEARRFIAFIRAERSMG
ncbi:MULTISPECIES: helix-turn-helix domain-containing protein [Paenibacillus]|uniref:Helix-turn-helix transcriptional regulator n=1 Tax=Paenibacillus radicis (ex Xue et al. 2023) TaxID=2972489 RepID=A0ABT1YG48_9BACL|nr:helix-turn-helix transcriptional regulator [Paenibacillus radicis (ex Xue et al. 2023)]MCR8631364.1 helix-turn-helix transcriptional regulator [Paenibacillus radicis (ex Xue et al. 2023)]